MANEFKIKKGLIVTGADGETAVDIQGSQGQLFSVTDDLSGSIFAVSDISGVPILDVNSSGLVTVDGPFTQTGGGDSNFSGDVNIKSVFDFADSTVRRAMTPRIDVEALDIISDQKTIFETISKNGYSRYPIYENNKVVGRATGGDFGFRLGKSIALGMVNPDVATTGQKLKIDILGKMYDATILDESPYDPENNLLRA